MKQATIQSQLTLSINKVLSMAIIGLSLVSSTQLNAQKTSKVFEPKTDLYLSGLALNTNLDNFNKTLPANADKIGSQNAAMGFGFTSMNRRFAFNSEAAFSFRQRSVFSNIEQIYVTRGRWSVNAGRHLLTNKSKTLIITPMIGFTYDQLTMNYRNDSFAKPSSINWVVRDQFPNLNTDEETQDQYINPSFAVLAQLRVYAIIKNRYTISGMISYQQDISKGRWHYDYGFIRTNSPQTYTTGLNYGITLGFLLKESDFLEEKLPQ